MTSAIFLLLVFCPDICGVQNLTITDDLGYTHVLGKTPQRIISLAPNVTEILFALGLEKRIIGVTRYCNFPKQALKITRIGGMVDPNLEKIIDLHPDLIIAIRGNPLRLVKRLKDLELPVFVLETGTTLESVFFLIQRISLITRREKAAENLNGRLRTKMERIENVLKNARTLPKVFINLHGNGLWTCGKNSFLNDLVRKAKGVNIAGETSQAWFAYNREDLIHQNPDYIVIIARTKEDFFSVKHWFTSEAYFEAIQAVQNENIRFLNEDLVTRPGPRIFEALDQLSRILHAPSFKDGK